MDSSYNKIWKIVLDSLSQIYSEVLMDLWLNRLELVSIDDKNAILVIDENEDLIDILNANYSQKISEAFAKALSLNLNVKIYKKGKYFLRGSEEEKEYLRQQEEEKAKEAEKTEKSDEFYFVKGEQRSHENEYTFENFIVGSSNKFAYAASVAVANHPASENNPLFIYGASGLGKTHLMRAIAHDVSKRYPDFNIIFVSAENFTNEFLDCLVKKSTAKFKEKYRAADMLFVDDIQFIAGKESTQEEFFHTFNALYDAHKQIVLTSDRPPRELQNLEERLVSRFEGGMVADVQPPDTELRIAIFKSKAMAMNVDLSNDVLTYIAENTKSNVRQIEGIIKKLGAYKTVLNKGKDITVDDARTLLSGIISGAEPPEATAEKVIANVANRYGVPADDIKGTRRSKEIVTARQIAIYVVNHVTNLTLKNIGNIFGGKDHSTILYSIQSVSDQMKKDISFEHEVNEIIKEFQ